MVSYGHNAVSIFEVFDEIPLRIEPSPLGSSKVDKSTR